MTIQTIEIHGERYVVLLEKDFLALQASRMTSTAPATPPANAPGKFRDVAPLRVSGTPASEILLQDRK